MRMYTIVRRDVAERGRTVESVLNQYLTFVKPAFDNFILPTKRYADIIIPRGGDNEIAINLMASHIRRKLESRGFVNTNLVRSLVPSDFELDDSSLPKNVLVLPQNNTIKYIHTQLRDKNTEQEEFQFQVDRLTRLLMDMLHDVLPVQVQSVKTPTNGDFYGEDLKNKICGVSIVRSGLGLENALRTMYPDTSFGKIIVQQTKDKKEGPRLYYCKFPPNMQKMKVVLLDAMCSTGNVVSMAIRVLLDHNVPEENITFMCLMVCPEGAMQLARSYPKIKIITSWVEERVDHRGFAVPGMGSFGDRYFGTQSVSYDDLAYDGVPRSTNPSKANSMIGSRSGSEHGFSDIKKNLESLVLSDSSLGQTDIAK